MLPSMNINTVNITDRNNIESVLQDWRDRAAPSLEIRTADEGVTVSVSRFGERASFLVDKVTRSFFQNEVQEHPGMPDGRRKLEIWGFKDGGSVCIEISYPAYLHTEDVFPMGQAQLLIK